MIEFQNIKIGDLCNVTSSKRIYKKEYVENGIPFYRGKEIIELANNESIRNSLYISENRYKEIIKKYGAPVKNDILMISIGATLGIPYLIDQDSKFYFKDGNVTWFKDFTERIYSPFLYTWLKSNYGNKILWSSIIGSAQPALTLASIKNITISVPQLAIQKKIVSILSAYDKLIENNTRRIQILEEMAQRIYKEWFVDFKYPGHENDKLVDSELGIIPDGWEVLPLNEIINIKSGFAFKSSSFESDGSYGLVTIKNVQDGVFITKCQNHLNVTPDKMPEYCMLRGGDIILSLTGNVGRVCLVYGENYLLNQRVAKLIPKNIADRAFVYSLFRNNLFQRNLEMISTGTAQQNLSPILMGKYSIISPHRNILSSFSNKCNPILDEILLLFIKNNNLRQTRDLLLPKLISGKVDVSDLDIDTSILDD